MPRTCTVCGHKERQAIDEALVAGEAFRHIAARYDTSTGALQRHKDHLPRKLVKAAEAREVAQAGSLPPIMGAVSGRTPVIGGHR